jgi:hypothetical protein
MSSIATRFSQAIWAGTRALLYLSVFASCAGQPQKKARHAVLERAPIDLDCTEEEVKVRSLENGTTEARGCGIKAIYVESCQSNFNAAASATVGMPISKKTCQWELESRGPDR